MQNNILIISYHFPPEKSGGTGRPYSLYKYLPNHGITPIIITHHGYGQLRNDKNIIRCNSLSDWRNYRRPGKKLFLKIFSKLLNHAGASIQRDFFWQRQVLNTADTIITSNKIKAIYSTYPEIDAMALGLHLSEKHKLPLIAEFRDGLLFEPLSRYNIMQKGKIGGIEKRIVDRSKAVITIGKNLSQYYIDSYDKRKVFTIHNGYDPDDFEGLQNLPSTSGRQKLKIVHFGGLSTSRSTNINSLLHALQRLKNNRFISEQAFELSLIGNYTRTEHKLVQALKLNDIIRFYPPMKKKEGFGKIKSEYDFLLFHGVRGSKTVISSKLPEYLKLDKPILGICRGNEAQDIILRTGTGEVCDFETDSIYALFKKFIEGLFIYNPDKTEIEKFNRKAQTKQIANVIKTALLNQMEERT